MRTLEYTDKRENKSDFDSSSIDVLTYNENINRLAVEWQDSDHETYIYEDVSKDEFDALFNGSVGANVNALRRGKTSREKLDHCWDVNWVQVDAKPVAQTVGATKEFSLQSPATPSTPVKAEGGLGTVSTEYKYTLFWDLDLGGKVVERTTVLDAAKSLDEALNTLDAQAKALGLEIKVKKALVEFV